MEFRRFDLVVINGLVGALIGSVLGFAVGYAWMRYAIAESLRLYGAAVGEVAIALVISVPVGTGVGAVLGLIVGAVRARRAEARAVDTPTAPN